MEQEEEKGSIYVPKSHNDEVDSLVLPGMTIIGAPLI
jgi:hypothetical protein